MFSGFYSLVVKKHIGNGSIENKNEKLTLNSISVNIVTRDYFIIIYLFTD